MMRRSLVLGCVLLACTCIFVAETARPETTEWKDCKDKYKKAQPSPTPDPSVPPACKSEWVSWQNATQEQKRTQKILECINPQGMENKMKTVNDPKLFDAWDKARREAANDNSAAAHKIDEPNKKWLECKEKHKQ
jgi:hypothetical protein